MPSNRERLHRLIEKLCIIEGDFVLSTGAKSRYYFDCKTVALDGEGLTLIASEFLKEIEKLPVLRVCGHFGLENLGGRIYHTPLSSRLQMSDEVDRLSLAYNTFFADLFVPRPSDDKVTLRYVISGKGTPPEEARLTLQLCLKASEELETASGGKIVLGAERLDLSDLGEWIRHHGWTLKIPASAKLVWPVYPYNPYTAAPEKDLKYAVGALSVSLRLKEKPGHYVRPAEQEIVFDLSAK